MKLISLIAAIVMTAPVPALKAADEQNIKPYALETCFISGDKLGEMGKPFVFVHEGQQFKLCCKDCKKTFDKDPAAAVKKYEAAVQSKSSDGANTHAH